MPDQPGEKRGWRMRWSESRAARRKTRAERAQRKAAAIARHNELTRGSGHGGPGGGMDGGGGGGGAGAG